MDNTLINPLHLKKLVWETCPPEDKAVAVYTLKPQEHQGLPSLYQLYMAMEDIIEYDFAKTYLASWSHWERLCQCPWFQPHINAWRKELAIKVKAEAVREIRLEAAAGGKNSYQANKWLVDKGWIGQEAGASKRVGRPKKEDILPEIDKQDLADDLKRMIN
jgi:hypothetical protein